MQERYYHGLAGGIPFWEEQEVLDESLRVLDLIFKTGDLHCRNYLIQHEIAIYNEKDPIYNGEIIFPFVSKIPVMNLLVKIWDSILHFFDMLERKFL